MDIDQQQRAWKLASKYHDGQKYGGPIEGQQIEYLEHIGSVLFEVNEAINNDSTIDKRRAVLGAIFHDLLEDTECTKDEIGLHYGTDILEIVKSLTKNGEIGSKYEMMLDSLNRIQKTHREAAIVKLADRISNLYAPPFYWGKEKMESYIIESKLIFERLKSQSEYLSKRLFEKIEKYQIDFIRDHEQDYLLWTLKFGGTLCTDNFASLIDVLKKQYGKDKTYSKIRVFGDQIRISTDDCTLWIEGNENGNKVYRISLDEDNFSHNSERFAFFKDLKIVLKEKTENLDLVYYFENNSGLSNDFKLD